MKMNVKQKFCHSKEMALTFLKKEIDKKKHLQ